MGLFKLIVLLLFVTIAGLIDRSLGGGVLMGAVITALLLKKSD